MFDTPDRSAWRVLANRRSPAYTPQEVRLAIAAAGLALEEVRSFGRSWSPTCHLWFARKP